MASLESHKLSSQEVATALGLTKQQIYLLRKNGSGPEFLKIGRKVIYERDAVERWLDSRRRTIVDNSPVLPTRQRRLAQQAA